LNQNPEQSGFLKNQEELNVLNSGDCFWRFYYAYKFLNFLYKQ
jgi:hypothetical protein